MTWNNYKKIRGKKAPPTQKEILNKITSITNERDKRLIAFTYWSAGRITEVLGARKENINDEMLEHEGKKRRTLVVTIPNLKHRRKKYKTLAMPYDKEELLNNIIKKCARGDKGPVFTIGYNMAWQIVNKHMGFNPHYLRVIRLTHLVKYYDFNVPLLIRWAGWSDARQSERYMELRYQDFLTKL